MCNAQGGNGFHTLGLNPGTLELVLHCLAEMLTLLSAKD